jgi:carboxymethylenebutenolidase
VCIEDDNRDPTGAPDSIVLTASDGSTFGAYLATAAPTVANLVLLPDNGGLRPLYQHIADRFARSGATTLVIDYFGRTAGTGLRGEDVDLDAHHEAFNRDAMVLDVRAAMEHLADLHPGPVFVAGFCVGGANALYAGAKAPGLAGVIAICAWLGRFGTSPELTDDFASTMPVPVLGLFGGADEPVPVAVPENLDRQLDLARVAHRVVIYPGQPHGFLERDHMGEPGHEDAAADAWRRIEAFLATGEPRD